MEVDQEENASGYRRCCLIVERIDLAKRKRVRVREERVCVASAFNVCNQGTSRSLSEGEVRWESVSSVYVERSSMRDHLTLGSHTISTDGQRLSNTCNPTYVCL